MRRAISASLTQSAHRPFQNYYNEADDRTAVAVSYYLSEGQDGRKAVSEVYRYSSVLSRPARLTMSAIREAR